MSVENNAELLWQGKPNKNLCQCHFACHKSRMDWPGLKPGPATDYLRHGKAKDSIKDWLASIVVFQVVTSINVEERWW
jgi:hypothetical protein